MPPVVAAAVSWIGAALYAVPQAWVLIAYSSQIAWAMTTAAAIAYSRSQTSKLRRQLGAASLDQGRSVMVRDPVTPRRLIYGEVLVSGPLAFVHVAGTKNEYLYLIVILAGHEVEEIGDVYFGDEVVPFDGVDNAATGKYAGFARCLKKRGVPGDTADHYLVGEIPSVWTNDHKLSGCAYVSLRIKYTPDLFPNGIPQVRAVVKGKRVYDPRTDSVAYSTNAALCAADYLTDTVFGKGVAWERVRLSDLTEAANICDEDVVLADASTEKRYTTNGTINADQDPGEILRDLAGAMSGHVVDTGGTWTVRAGAYRSATTTLTDDDIIGPFSVQPRQSRQDTFNRVRGLYISSINQWAPADFPPISNTTYKDKDGGVWLERDVQYNFTTSAATAQRLAKIELERGRQQITVTSTWSLKALELMPGDVVAITRSRLGWAAKEFEVVDWNFKMLGEGEDVRLGIEMTLRETAEGVWDWNDGEETTVDLAPNTTLPNPFSVPTPTITSLSDTTTVLVQPDGTVQPRIKVSWTTPNNIHVESGGFVELEYKRSSSSTWLPWNAARGDTLEDYIAADLLVGVNYDVRVRFRNNTGVRGLYDTDFGVTAIGDTQMPSAPTSLTANAFPGYISLAWVPSTSNTVNEYLIYRSVTSALTGFTLLASTAAAQFDDPDVTPGTTYWYRVVAQSRSEISSSILGPSSGVIALNPAVGAAVPSSPTAATDLGSGSAGTYGASDGAVFAYRTIRVPALPTNAVWQNLLYRRNGASEWLVAAQLKNTGNADVRLDDLTPGVSYDVATQAWSAAGGSSVVSATGSPFTAPGKSSGSAAPSSITVVGPSSTVVIPPYYDSLRAQWFGARASWAASSDPDVVAYEWTISAAGDDTGANTAWGLGVGRRVSTLQDFVYIQLPITSYVSVRSVNSSGYRSSWLHSTTNLSSVVSVAAGSMSQQNASDVNVTAIKTGSGTVNDVLIRQPYIGGHAISGGGTTATLNLSLSGYGFGTAPDAAWFQAADISACEVRYDWDDSSSSTAVLRIRSLDGTALPGSIIITGELVDYFP